MLRIGEMQATEPAEKLYGGADVNKEHSSESLEKSEKAHILGIAEKKKSINYIILGHQSILMRSFSENKIGQKCCSMQVAWMDSTADTLLR